MYFTLFWGVEDRYCIGNFGFQLPSNCITLFWTAICQCSAAHHTAWLVRKLRSGSGMEWNSWLRWSRNHGWQGDKPNKCNVHLSFSLLRGILLRPKRLIVTGDTWHFQVSKKKWSQEDGRPGVSPSGSPKALGSCKMATGSYRNQIPQPFKDVLFKDVQFELKPMSTSFFSPQLSGGYALIYIPGYGVLSCLEWDSDKSMLWHLPTLSNLLFCLWKPCMVEGKKAVCWSLVLTDTQALIRAQAAESRCLEAFPNPLGQTQTMGPEAYIIRIICFNGLLNY